MTGLLYRATACGPTGLPLGPPELARLQHGIYMAACRATCIGEAGVSRQSICETGPTYMCAQLPTFSICLMLFLSSTLDTNAIATAAHKSFPNRSFWCRISSGNRSPLLLEQGIPLKNPLINHWIHEFF